MQKSDKLREPVKYYFADFVRKWGTPHPPVYAYFFWQKGGYGFRGSPRPPFTDKIRKVVFDGFPKITGKLNLCVSKPSVPSRTIFYTNCILQLNYEEARHIADAVQPREVPSLEVVKMQPPPSLAQLNYG